jgi:class 3 adenylate cyclase
VSGSRYLTDHRIEDAVVWFSDIVNFTRSVLELQPVRTADLVQRFFNAQAEAIESHSGHIDKFMGDGLMAFWILPTGDRKNCAETCEEALAAAEEAVRSVSLVHVGAKPLELRVGLHTGSTLSGDFGSTHRHQFTLIGAAVNKAAQLEQIHEDQVTDGDSPGPVRISAEFHDALSTPTRQRYDQRNFAVTRKLGTLEFYSSSESPASAPE